MVRLYVAPAPPPPSPSPPPPPPPDLPCVAAVPPCSQLDNAVESIAARVLRTRLAAEESNVAAQRAAEALEAAEREEARLAAEASSVKAARDAEAAALRESEAQQAREEASRMVKEAIERANEAERAARSERCCCCCCGIALLCCLDNICGLGGLWNCLFLLSPLRLQGDGSPWRVPNVRWLIFVLSTAPTPRWKRFF